MDLEHELAALRCMSLPELQAQYAALTDEQTTVRHKGWLLRRIAWQLQARAEGGLSERARHRAAELADGAELRLLPTRRSRQTEVALAGGRLPPPGTVLARPYKGRLLRVRVLPKGFEHEGKVFRSLSAVAKAITGSHTSGFLFFRLTHNGTSHEQAQRPS